MIFGSHGLVWTGSFDEAGLRTAVVGNAAAGYDILEIPLLDPFAFDLGAAQRVLAEHSTRITASLGLSAGTDISSEDPGAVAAGERLLERAVEVTAELGGRWLVGVIYGAMRKHERPLTPTGRHNGQAVLRRVADHAAARGVSLAVEVVNRYETNVINTARQAIAYLREIDHDNIRLHLDTYHMNIEESGLFEPFLDAGDLLGYVHIGESHRGYLGTGTVDFAATFRALARIDYTGPVVFESFSNAVVDPTLSNTLGVWRNLWDDSDDLARHAIAFMRGQERAVQTIAMH
ncbi:sugar phosphate isomerase/epimerase family protein [Microbacterium flavum]|uniref:Sugar phosphate isomerase/epimerase n=1 Tax=Microbacterium flavum TaxID=415216 RepID=A0ABS5XQE9_9MICO|nr:sugar phosphate isomerase/epimerase [Microbacterium flavum]MBT8796752.1 sugar phosphate isomerase/epimerase [Microbacterium flavum]